MVGLQRVGQIVAVAEEESLGHVELRTEPSQVGDSFRGRFAGGLTSLKTCRYFAAAFENLLRRADPACELRARRTRVRARTSPGRREVDHSRLEHLH